MATASPLRMLLLLGPLSALGSLCIDMYLPALPSISRDLDAGTSATQASLTTCLVGLALGQALAGRSATGSAAGRRSWPGSGRSSWRPRAAR